MLFPIAKKRHNTQSVTHSLHLEAGTNGLYHSNKDNGYAYSILAQALPVVLDLFDIVVWRQNVNDPEVVEVVYCFVQFVG